VQLRGLLPPKIPMTPDIKSAFFYVVAYYLGLSWVLPISHEICGLKISGEIAEFITPGLINDMHSRNRKIALFGPSLDDQEIQKKMINMGVDIIITDRPDFLRDNLDKMNKNHNIKN